MRIPSRKLVAWTSDSSSPRDTRSSVSPSAFSLQDDVPDADLDPHHAAHVWQTLHKHVDSRYDEVWMTGFAWPQDVESRRLSTLQERRR